MATLRDWRLIAAGVLAVLRLPQAAYGVLVAGLAAGGVAGSLLADRIGRRWGAGHAIAASLWASVLAYAGMGLAATARSGSRCWRWSVPPRWCGTC